MYRSAALSALACVALTASTNTASAGQSSVARLANGSVTEATRFWHGLRPPCGKPVVTVTNLPAGQFADATPRTCALRIDQDTLRFERPFVCTILVHEYGHLLGFAHDMEPRSVMRTGHDRDTLVKGCVVRFDGALWAYDGIPWAVSTKRPVMLPNSMLPPGVGSWWEGHRKEVGSSR